jgi:hypothetical protein
MQTNEILLNDSYKDLRHSLGTSLNHPRTFSNSSKVLPRFSQSIDFTSQMKNFINNYDELIRNLKQPIDDHKSRTAKHQTVKIKGNFFPIEPKQEVVFEDLTNSEDIKDFYEYTQECLKKLSNLKIPKISDILKKQIILPLSNESNIILI